MPYSNVGIAEYSKRIGKSVPTLWRWIKQAAIFAIRKAFVSGVTRNTIRETNI